MTQHSTWNSGSSALKTRSAHELDSADEAELPKTGRAGVVVVAVITVALLAWVGHRLASAEATGVPAKASVLADTPAARSHEPLTVSVVRPTQALWSAQVQLEGSLAPQRTTQLSFNVPGTLSKLSARVGDEVKAGARLAQLDPGRAVTDFAATAAGVKQASAQLAIADDLAYRNALLEEKGAVSESGSVNSVLHRSVAVAQLEAAQARHSQAQVILSDHTLRAPFSGTVIEAPDAVGAVVAPGVALFKVADLSTLKLNATLNEADAKLIHVGAKVYIAGDGETVEGRITRILDALDAHSRRVPIQAELAQPGGLHAGSYVQARVEAHEPVPVLRLPRGVLKNGQQNEVLIVVPGYSPALELRKIVYESEPSGELLVRSGLTPDDAVVLDPKPESQAGDLVVVRDGSAQPAGAK